MTQVLITREPLVKALRAFAGVFNNLRTTAAQVEKEPSMVGLTGDLNILYADANQDGVVDGTSIREEALELRRYDGESGSYVQISSIVLTEHNMIHASPIFMIAPASC